MKNYQTFCQAVCLAALVLVVLFVSLPATASAARALEEPPPPSWNDAGCSSIARKYKDPGGTVRRWHIDDEDCEGRCGTIDDPPETTPVLCAPKIRTDHENDDIQYKFCSCDNDPDATPTCCTVALKRDDEDDHWEVIAAGRCLGELGGSACPHRGECALTPDSMGKYIKRGVCLGEQDSPDPGEGEE